MYYKIIYIYIAVSQFESMSQRKESMEPLIKWGTVTIFEKVATSQLQLGHAANEAFGTQEEDFLFCERVFLHRYSLSFRDLHGDMQVLWLKMSKSEISFGKGAPISTSMFVFAGSKATLLSSYIGNVMSHSIDSISPPVFHGMSPLWL